MVIEWTQTFEPHCICTYYDNLTGLKIFIADIAANYCCRASVTTRDTKHSLIPFVCVLSDILL